MQKLSICIRPTRNDNQRNKKILHFVHPPGMTAKEIRSFTYYSPSPQGSGGDISNK